MTKRKMRLVLTASLLIYLLCKIFIHPLAKTRGCGL